MATDACRSGVLARAEKKAEEAERDLKEAELRADTAEAELAKYKERFGALK